MAEGDLLGAADLDGAARAAGDLDRRVAEVELDGGQRAEDAEADVARLTRRRPPSDEDEGDDDEQECGAGDEPPPWRRPPGGAWQSNG